MVKNDLRPPNLNITPEEYKKLTTQLSPKPTLLKNTLLAFLVGGLICGIGQIFVNFYMIYGGLPPLSASTAGTASLIVIGAVLTGLGLYDDIVKVGGAGGIIPVTGFANSMVSPALEYKKEGYVFGVGVKLFSVAGPVLVYGISSSIIVGLIYYILSAIKIIS